MILWYCAIAVVASGAIRRASSPFSKMFIRSWTLISSGSDLVPAVEAVLHLKPGKRIVPAFPPNRFSKELVDVTKMQPIKIWEPLLRKSRLSETIKRDGLPDVVRPERYSGKPGCTSVVTPPTTSVGP